MLSHYDRDRIQPIPRQISTFQPRYPAGRQKHLCDFSCRETFVSVFCGCHWSCSVASAALRCQTSAVSTSRQGCGAVSAPTRQMRTSQIYSHAQKAPTLEVCVNPAAPPSPPLIRRNLIADASFVHHQGFEHSTGFFLY